MEGNNVEISQPLNTNPLLDEYILDNLFKVALLDLQTIKNVRLVCSTWHNVSLSRWRQDHCLVISLVEHDEKYSNLSMRKYLHLINRPDDPFLFRKHPFNTFRVKDCCLCFCDEYTRLKLRFWGQVGPLMSTLSITSSRFHHIEDLIRILFQFTPNLQSFCWNENYETECAICDRDSYSSKTGAFWLGSVQPNLRKLRITYLSESDRARIAKGFFCDVDYWFPTRPLELAQFFLRIPNLIDLRLVNTDDEFRQESSSHCVFEELDSIRDNENSPKLQVLDILNSEIHGLREFDLDVVFYLRELALPLTSLSIDIGIQTRHNVLQEILTMHSDTLEKLVVYRGRYYKLPYRSSAFKMEVPYLSNLQELLLDGPIVRDLGFVKYTPNLKVLWLENDEVEKHRCELDCSVSTSCYSVSSNSSSDSDGSFSNKESDCEYQIEVIKNTNFTALKNNTLEALEEFVGLSNETCNGKQVKELSKLMPNLKRLKLKVTNDGFEAICRNWPKLEMLDIRGCEVSLVAFIRSVDELKGLRSLKMGDPDLTDTSVFYGINQLPCLTKLTAWCSSSMTDDTFTKLKSKFPNSKIIRRE